MEHTTKTYCNYCNKWIICKSKFTFGGHKATCKSRPEYGELVRIRTQRIGKQPYKFICMNCKKEFIVNMTKYLYEKTVKQNELRKYCSVKCSVNHHFQAEEFECPWCGKFFNMLGMYPHVWRVHTEEGRKSKPGSSNIGQIPWIKGRTKETEPILLITSKKISKKLKGRPGHKLTEETKKKLSDIAIERMERTRKMNNNCSVKNYKYTSPTAGEVTLDGGWELKVAKHLDATGVKWIRNRKPFKYNSIIKGRISLYFPDFYVYDWNTYIEVKGYKTDIDNEKWSQFPEPLEIWDEKKLKELNLI